MRSIRALCFAGWMFLPVGLAGFGGCGGQETFRDSDASSTEDGSSYDGTPDMGDGLATETADAASEGVFIDAGQPDGSADIDGASDGKGDECIPLGGTCTEQFTCCPVGPEGSYCQGTVCVVGHGQ